MSLAQITVRSFGAEAIALEHCVALASLPTTFRLLQAGRADIALVGPEDASIETGLETKPRALVLTEPAATPPALLERLHRADIPVFPVLALFHTLQGNWPAVPVFEAVLVRARLLTGDNPKNALLEQFAALQGRLGPLADIALLSGGSRACAGSARTQAGVPVLWNSQAGANVDSFELDVIGMAERLEIICTLGMSAIPTQVSIGGAAGIRQQRGIYESGLRLFWRAVAAEFAGTTATPKIAEISALLTLVQHLDRAGENEHARISP